MAAEIENWDDDADFQGDLFTNSVSTVQTSLSSRLSVRSESNAGDEDWQVLLTPSDEHSTLNAISSAKQAGIPIPSNVPSSALLGGSIKRLGKNKSRQQNGDDWGDDLELPGTIGGGLKLKTPAPQPKASQNEDEDWGDDLDLSEPATGGLQLKAGLPSRVTPTTPAQDEEDFDDWAEGSLGIRFGGTKRDVKNRSSSVSAMSPSLGSCMTLESEEDDLGGLVLPSKPLDFNALLEKRKELQDAESTSSPPQPAPTAPPRPQEPAEVPASVQKPKPETEDFFTGLDIGAGEVFDTKKLTLNRNIKVQTPKTQSSGPRTATTLTFTDKASVSRIPRPMASTSKSSRLDPVYEAGAAQMTRLGRPAPTTTSAQLLKSKRSLPVLRNQYSSAPKPPVPFLPAGISNAQSHHVTAKPPMQYHSRRDSDPNRAMSPPPRSYSRLSTAHPPLDTPSRVGVRRGVAPAALAREAAAKTLRTAPIKRRNFGDGTELESFDDLPTSASKESKFIKAPSGWSNRGAPKALKQQLGQSRVPLPDRMTTPLPPATPLPPPTPRRLPGIAENTPRFARDTAASRIAREQRLAGSNLRPRGELPLAPVPINWKAQVAARSPHTSPTAQRGKKPMPTKGPNLIKQMSVPKEVKSQNGMTYNPHTQRWEGNENALHIFNHHHANPSATTLPLHTPTPISHTHTASGTILPPPQPQFHNHHNPHHHNHYQPPSPPRAAPALISHIAPARDVIVDNGMVFDPRAMKWLKLDAASTGEEEEDVFAGLDDLPDETAAASSATKQAGEGGGGGGSGKFVDDWAPVGEEFDVGPEFIRRQREEEVVWRKKVEGWMGVGAGEERKWEIRRLAAELV